MHMKSCNIRYIFQHTDKKLLKEIQNRNKEVQRLSLMSGSDVCENISNKVSENIIDIFSWELYEKEQIVAVNL